MACCYDIDRTIKGGKIYPLKDHIYHCVHRDNDQLFGDVNVFIGLLIGRVYPRFHVTEVISNSRLRSRRCWPKRVALVLSYVPQACGKNYGVSDKVLAFIRMDHAVREQRIASPTRIAILGCGKVSHMIAISALIEVLRSVTYDGPEQYSRSCAISNQPCRGNVQTCPGNAQHRDPHCFPSCVGCILNGGISNVLQ